jgi:hypothetical protein
MPDVEAGPAVARLEHAHVTQKRAECNLYQLRYNLYLAQPNYNKEIMGGEKIVLPRTLSLPINVAILWKNLIQIIYNKGF